MVYENKILGTSDFNIEVSGEKRNYQCWQFQTAALKRISDCKNFIFLKSCLSPIYNHNKEIINFKRNYLSISFYKDISDFKNETNNLNYDNFFIIPVNEDRIQEILEDIKKKHNL